MEQILYDILGMLLGEPLHVRGLANFLNVNHMTIQRKVLFLEKENVLDFKEVGKSKVYFLKNSLEAKEYLKIMEHNNLLKIINKSSRIRKIVEKINDLDVDLIILFGSYAKGNENSKSDIDIFLNTTNQKTKKDVEEIDSKISVKIGKFDKTNLLIKEIIKNHIILKGVDKYYEFVH